MQREDLVEGVHSLWYTYNTGVTVMQRIADNSSSWRIKMEMKYSKDDLIEAKRQIDSTLHKLRETIKTFESKENAERDLLITDERVSEDFLVQVEDMGIKVDMTNL